MQRPDGDAGNRMRAAQPADRAGGARERAAAMVLAGALLLYVTGIGIASSAAGAAAGAAAPTAPAATQPAAQEQPGPAANATSGAPAAATPTAPADEAESRPPPAPANAPRRSPDIFVPTETVPEDRPISFPVDI